MATKLSRANLQSVGEPAVDWTDSRILDEHESAAALGSSMGAMPHAGAMDKK